jgi:hypothetical protein
MEKTKRPLFVWWVITLLLAAVAYWLNTFGIFAKIFEADVSHVTQIIGLLFVIGNIRVGYLAWKWSRRDIHFEYKQFITTMRKHLDEWWFVAETFMALGILGTAIGMSVLFYTAFAPLVVGLTPEALQAIMPTLLPKVIAPLGTVFFTTAVGIAASILLKTQLFIFTSISGVEDERYE